MKNLLKCFVAYILGATIVGAILLGVFMTEEEWDSFWSGLAGLATTVTFLICL
jgi:hypothetical protein